MKSERLQKLYNRPLVRADLGSKSFPHEHNLKKEVEYYPEKPKTNHFDILEIGPGRGDFLFHLAQENPQKNLLAIEYGILRYKKLVKKVKQLNLSNIILIQGDARIPLAKDLKDTTFSQIFVLFPDPWPRNRHRHKRLLNEDFTRKLCNHLIPNGHFTLGTDVQDYAEWVKSHLEKFSDMQNTNPSTSQNTPLPDLIPTFFEQKWKDMGRICHYLRYQKIY